MQQVSIDALDGMTIPFAWAQVVRPITLERNAPTALIVGTAVELDERDVPLAPASDLDEHCRAIATMLARLGMNLVSDACPGLPHRMAQAYCRLPERGIAVDLSVLQRPDEVQEHRAYSPTGFPTCGDVRVFCGAGFEILSVLNTQCVDLVVVIGGGLGSLLEGIVAVVNDLPVVCFAASGGMSGEMESVFVRYQSTYKNLQIETVHTTDEMRRYLERFHADFARRNGVSRLYGFMSRLEHALSLGDTPTRVMVHPSLEHVSYDALGTTLTLRDPTLVIDDVRLAAASDDGVAVRDALDSTVREYVYDGVSLTVAQGIPRVVCCPSIDTFILLEAMRPHLRDTCATALDVGTGTGIVALWLSTNCNASRVVGVDSNVQAIRCATANAARSGLDDGCRFVAMRFQDFRGQEPPFDLIACNPPYIPRLGVDGREDSGFEGVDLVTDLLRSLDDVLTPNGIGFVTMSSTTWTDPTVRGLVESLAGHGRAIRLTTRRVPFKVPAIVLDRPWLTHLVGAGGLQRRHAGGYDFWHDVQVWKVGNRPLGREGAP